MRKWCVDWWVQSERKPWIYFVQSCHVGLPWNNIDSHQGEMISSPVIVYFLFLWWSDAKLLKWVQADPQSAFHFPFDFCVCVWSALKVFTFYVVFTFAQVLQSHPLGTKNHRSFPKVSGLEEKPKVLTQHSSTQILICHVPIFFFSVKS